MREKMWWLNEESSAMLNKGYLLTGESVEGAIDRITSAAANRLGMPELKDRFKELIERGWMSLSSPIWANMGTERGLPISCFNVHVPDNIEGITHKLGEVIMQTKLGGGTSGYFGELRGRGTPVTNNGESSGAVSFMKLNDTAMTTISQGGVRRGAFAAYLDIDHPDIAEFLQIKDIGNPIQNLFTGVCIPDYWMREMIGGDSDKRNIWAKVLESRQQKGLPYLFFTDNVNRNKPRIYKDRKLSINASNLCVHGDTQILTSFGYNPIGELEGEIVDVWNGHEWSEVQVFKTGTNKELLKITTSNGQDLKCTPHHKFYIQKGYDRGTGVNKLEIVEVRAKDLKTGDKLIKFDLPVIKGTEVLDNSYMNGFYSGDGCLTTDGQRIYLYGDKKKLISKFNMIKSWYNQPEQDRMYGHTNVLKDKFFVPDASYTIESRLEWLSGYLDADGTVTNNNGSQSIQASSVEKEFLKEIQLMLQTLGVDSKVTLNREEGEYFLPKNNGSGELQLYKCKEIYRILINGNSLYKLSQLGLKCERLEWNVMKPNRECSHFIKIESVESMEGLHDTYCFTEPKRNLGMFNGILTGQCSEIALPSTVDESFVCCLSSMNLELYDEWKDTDAVKLAIFFLDAVMSEFIEKTEDNHYLKAANTFAKRHRALGLGVLGWHSYLQKNMIPIESWDAKAINTEIFKYIKEESYKASEELGEILGYAPIFLEGETTDVPRRNTTTMAVAPTTSSSSILGQASMGIEPFSSNYYKAGLSKGNFIRKNKYLADLLIEKGLDNEEVWRQIMLSGGSVQNLEGLTRLEKDVFKTFKEINQAELVNLAASRQRFIDQSQSLNINIPPTIPIRDVNSLIINGWESGVSTFYYQRSQSVAKEQAVNLVNCNSCEA